MTKKYDLITELYDAAIKKVTENPENWMYFLKSACRNYRLPFDEQLLIHVQHPEALAVLPMEDWNKKFGRWVKRDSKGIAVFDKNAGTMRLKYYFDISDTKEGRYRRLIRPVPLWEVREGYRQEVQETLVNAFGVSEEMAGLGETIMKAARNVADDNLTDYMHDILSGRKESFLEELDEYNVEVEVKDLLANSIAYMVMLRCGIDTEDYLEAEDFRNITDFNTPELANMLGTATSDMSEMALSQIADTIKKLQAEEKRKNRTFAGTGGEKYNESAKENITSERSLAYEGNQLQQTGRIFSAEFERRRRTGSTHWEVWLTPPEISEGKPLRNIHKPADTGKIERTPNTDAERGTEQNGADYKRNGEVSESDRGAEGKRPDDVAANDEQYPSGGGGNRDERADIHLDWYDRSNEDKSLPFFGKDEDIKSLLLSTPHLKVAKGEIKAFYETHEDKNERTEYVKSIFNNEYTEITLEDGRRVGYKIYQNVLHMWEGSYQSRTSQSYYNWDVIADYFEGMRLLGELKDKADPLLTEAGQLSFMESMAEEKTSAFSFSQEIIDYVLLSGSGMEHGKYRIYSFFLQGHTTKEKEDFLKNEYGTGGRSDIIIGTGIGEAHDAKGIKLHRGYGDNAPEILLKWNQVVKRIEELIAVDRYMSKKELEYLPEYEKDVLAAKIYYFYYNQPEEIVRPYPYGADYYAGVRAVRPQLDELEHVNEILAVMDEVFENTADFARNYAFMQKAYKDLTDYRNGVYSLFSPLPAKTENIQTQTMPKPTEIQSREEILAERLNVFYQEYDIYDYQINVEAGQTQEEVKIKIREQLLDPQYVGTIYDFLASVSMEMEPEDEQYAELQELLKEVASLPSMNPPYDLKVDTIVYIGTAEYEIQFLSDEMVVLHDLTYPLFTKEMSRQEFDRKLRENPANDHLHSKQSLLETQAEKKKEESPSELSEKEGIPIENQSEYPIFRKESMKSVQDLLKEEQPSTENEAPTKIVSEELAPAWEKTKSPHGVQTYDLHPEIPQHQRNQYCITNDKLGYGTQKEKFRANIMAIQLLKKCEEENRFATPDEQEILAKYVGWGGLSDAFDETKSAWSYEYLELKTVLTPEEYDAARQSTLTAFYTPPVVVKAIYQVLENMGLKSGNILEPSCAVGNFIGMKPESLSDCKVYGVEIDSISGRIAGQLYQKSAIAVQGYEEAELPDSFFDAAVGNVPFGQFKLSDKRYDKYNFLVHDYFFAKTLDKVRPGGVIAFITSSGTMDKKNPSIRKYIAQRAELLGAIRLPNDTFKKNAGTEVTSDILFLQKRDRMIETEPDWLYLDTDENGITQNRYFIDHPEMILGEMVMESTQFGMGSTCRIYADSSLEELLQAAIENIQAEISEYEMDELVEEEDKSIPAEPSVANFSYTVIDGKIYYRENSRMKLVELSVTGANRVRGMVAIRDCVRELIAYQTEGYADRVIEKQQEKLNRLYDAFQKK